MKYLQTLTLVFMLIFVASCGNDTSLEETITTNESETPTAERQLWFEWVGTEPFWAFRYTGGTLTWQVPGDNGTVSSSAPGKASIDEKTQNITIIAGDFTWELTLKACSDGMTENKYDYSLVVKKGEQEFKGCAREYIK